MKNLGQFEETYGHGACAGWEAMLPDAVDGTLTAAEQQAFEQHIAGCVRCSEEYEHAQRGAAWLTMLKGHTPEPPASLMEKILASTTGAQAAAPVFVPDTADIWTRPRIPEPAPKGWFAAFWSRTADTFRIENASASFQPRFAMTAAMAFFSIALSLNLMGIRLADLGHLNLHPGSLSRTVADTSASMTRSFQNLRVVYQLESRVNDLRRDEMPEGFRSDDNDTQSAPKQQDGKPSQDKPVPHGTSELTLPTVPKPTHTTNTIVRKEV